ncbi:hypothetical protein [Clavibacter michiganensis]|uniref:Uncharacterized protein n=1 Tax=Clavibacter michiganensis subsp. insidiosus TaxID=33014 RepID=A0A0D5CJM4_9MICO|nr:hypothetical protein [Clavibacter michiganensis]AJW79843.1 hypothetical protein VO01_12560 [Clavibacter michiganensis subsp. insidiosus]AWF97535.1 hypothetical protein BEH61_03355 [Clavibacter michiganensis subsp. insidiosus]AWG02374.1 hypothetical protein BEH62_12300 [Clavibacter michiganensis subsp. insidiosus]OQJ59174.1 hypothetical protein B5P21_04095 [Clavibacter michiganensis subsp. insidiosus]RII86401.1 hypothetical protein DZF92_10715 [Clavibacter michiganensis subsp. insidiosus]
MHVVPLGYIGEFEGKPSLALLDPLTSETRHHTLAPETAQLLRSIDPTLPDQDLDEQERRLLVGYAKLGIVALIGDDAPLSALDVIPVPVWTSSSTRCSTTDTASARDPTSRSS